MTFFNSGLQYRTYFCVEYQFTASLRLLFQFDREKADETSVLLHRANAGSGNPFVPT